MMESGIILCIGVIIVRDPSTQKWITKFEDGTEQYVDPSADEDYQLLQSHRITCCVDSSTDKEYNVISSYHLLVSHYVRTDKDHY